MDRENKKKLEEIRKRAAERAKEKAQRAETIEREAQRRRQAKEESLLKTDVLGTSRGSFADFALFRMMVSPILLRFLYWLATVSVIIGAGHRIFSGQVMEGVVALFAGPLLVRLSFEILVVVFRINETLTEILHAIEESNRRE